MTMIYWNKNIGGFVGAQRFIIGGQPFVNSYIASPVALTQLIQQARSISRFVFSGVFRRVN